MRRRVRGGGGVGGGEIKDKTERGNRKRVPYY
jgi:hypothetical protein